MGCVSLVKLVESTELRKCGRGETENDDASENMGGRRRRRFIA